MGGMLVAVNFQEFERKIIKALKDSNLIDRFSVNEFEQSPEIAIINKYFRFLHY